MQDAKYITIITDRRKIRIDISTILYAIMVGRCVEIHVSGGGIYETRMTLLELQKKLGESFIKVHRGCIVSAMAIHDVTDNINLSNGESLVYTLRKKGEILEQLRSSQKNLINGFIGEDIPATEEEYRRHYSSFDNMPFEGVISFVSLRFYFPRISNIGYCQNFQYLQGFVGSAHTRPPE